MRVRRSVALSVPPDAACFLELGESEPPLVWSEVFSVPVTAVEIEIGCGKGMFLREAAEARPDHGFIGVERAGKWLALCATRLARDEKQNVRLARYDAFDFLARWVPPRSVEAIHVYFPDPWPKKRHAKRRLLHPALYDLAARALREGGSLVIATDVGWYFEEAIEVLGAHPCFRRSAAPAEGPGREGGGGEATDVRTHYARKYAEEGRELRSACYVRTASPSPPLPPPPSRPRKSASTAPPSAP
jgi:tRNA (guanine-N7-)-methyltransferase